MNKAVLLSVCAAVIAGGCNTYTGSGAYMGASIGGILGSAIGGIGGGPRGSDVGTVIGMAGGAILGGAMGAKADQEEDMAARRSVEEHKARRPQHGYERGRNSRDDGRDDTYSGSSYGYHSQDGEYAGGGTASYQGNGNNEYARQGDRDSGFDPNGGGDDVLYDFNGSDYSGNYSAGQPATVSASMIESIGTGEPVDMLEIRNARFVDDNTDNVLTGGELSKVIFEIYNHSGKTLYDVQPTVREVTGNRRIYISPNIHVEKIEPGMGVRYTAMVKADRRVKAGEAVFQVYAVLGNGTTASKVKEFRIAVEKPGR